MPNGARERQSMAMPVLVTKLFIPRPRPNVVFRPRLIERLNEGLHRDLSLISAPAGFGKTTFVSEWVEGIERSTAWLSLDEGNEQGHQGSGRQWHDPQQPVEGIVTAAGQEARHACLRLKYVQENQAGHVQADQGDHGGAPQGGETELAQMASHLGIELAGGRVQAGRHEGNLRRDKVLVTSIVPVVGVSLCSAWGRSITPPRNSCQ